MIRMTSILSACAMAATLGVVLVIDNQPALAQNPTIKDKPVKYLILIYGNEATGINPESSDFEPYMAAYTKATETFSNDGALVYSEALEPTTNATTVRVRKGRTETMDGPYAETKEQLGGFYVLNCKNLDDAIRYAAMLPDAATGTIEIRPVMDLGDGS